MRQSCEVLVMCVNHFYRSATAGSGEPHSRVSTKPRPVGAVSRQCFNGVPDVPAAHQTMGNAFRAATARERSFKGVPRALRAIEDREAPSEPRPSESSPPWYFNGSVCTSSILPTQLTTPCGRGSVWLTRGAEEHGRT